MAPMDFTLVHEDIRSGEASRVGTFRMAVSLGKLPARPTLTSKWRTSITTYRGSPSLFNILGDGSEGFVDLEGRVKHNGVGTSLERSGRAIRAAQWRPSIHRSHPAPLCVRPTSSAICHLTTTDTDLASAWISESRSWGHSKRRSRNSREAAASETGDTRAKPIEEGERPTSKEAKPARGTRVRIQRSRTW
jgi:hypothetical protein